MPITLKGSRLLNASEDIVRPLDGRAIAFATPFIFLLPRPKLSHSRTSPLLYKTQPFSKEVYIAFSPSLSKDAVNLASQDLINMHILEELKIVKIAEEIIGIAKARHKPSAGLPPR
ncbi:hypothetical protein OBBRIDRAFT_805945 [Obba rivulosa]|uniref:Uncharacterized protein n=1 Tax=Obba rivulosa TaxID=1052685 RepID=A0A8E2AQQ6_9APHY|nr:hypothetical protein OBBRIDRAFT_805945 [Obba rivulosa]